MDANVHYIRYIYGFKFALKTPGSGSPLGLLAVLYGGYAYQQKQNQLDSMLDQVLGSACLSAADTRYYSSRLQGLNRQLLENQIMSYIFTIGGIAMAATGIGLHCRGCHCSDNSLHSVTNSIMIGVMKSRN